MWSISVIMTLIPLSLFMQRKPLRWLIVLFFAALGVAVGFLFQWFLGRDYYGVVTDIAGQPLPGATVQVGSDTVTADANGVFKVHSLSSTGEVVAKFNGEQGSTVLSVNDEATIQNLASVGTLTIDYSTPVKATDFLNEGGGMKPEDLTSIQTEIDSGYYPKPPVITQTATGVPVPPGSITVTVPTFQEEPDLPPLVDPDDFVVNEEGMEVVAGELVVGWKDGLSASDRKSIVEEAGGAVRYDDPLAKTTIVYVKDQKKVPKVLATLQKSEEITGVLENYRLYEEEAPNDPDYQDKAKRWWLRAVNNEPMWEMTKRGNKVIIAVIDAGFDFSHPDLQGVFTNVGLNYTASPFNAKPDHGTHVSGIIGALRNNGTGLMGITDRARIFPIKINDFARLPSVFARLSQYKNVRIATMSMGFGWGKVNTGRVQAGYRPLSVASMAQTAQNYDAIIRPAFQQFYQAGGVMCKSAGNDYGLDATLNLLNFPETIVVGAGGPTGALTNFSNVGQRVDIVAPGFKIWSTVSGGNYGYKSGTSMATPLVCGTVAAIRSLRPSYGAVLIKQILRMGGKQPRALGSGYLYFDAWRSLLRATKTFGVEGDVYKGSFEAVAGATVETDPPRWRFTTGEKGGYLIPYLLRNENGWVLKAFKDKLKGKERVMPPHPSDDVVRTVSIYLEGEETQETQTQETEEPTEENGDNGEQSSGDGQGTGSGDQTDGTANTEGEDSGSGKPTGSSILPNGVVVNSNGCAEGGYQLSEKEVGGYGDCPAGFYWSRETVACEQKVCPDGAGRTYTLECKCPEGQTGVYACGITGYMVACIPDKK